MTWTTIGTTTIKVKLKHFTASIRWRIMIWIIVVVFSALASMVFLQDTVRRSQVHTSANASVEKAVLELRSFSDNFGQDFPDSRSLLENFLRREIPDRNEVLIGVVDSHLIQQQGFKSSEKPAVLSLDEQLLRSVIADVSYSGITSTPEYKNVHWGKVPIGTEMHSNQEQNQVFYRTDYLLVLVFTSARYDAVAQETKLFAALGFLGLLLSAVIAWLVAAQVLVPVRALRDVAAQISDSDLKTRVPVHGDDEIAQLARTFNRMLDRIDLAYAAQRQFVDDAGHELRTPITVVRGHLELLESGDAAQRTRSIQLCTQELDRMTRMVNDLLTLAIADANAADFLHLAPCDLSELSISLDDKAAMLSQGRTDLVAIAEGVVLLDAERVTEAVLELVRNAVKYTDEVTPILLSSSLDESAQTVSFSVRDFGPGVKPEAKENLFKRFRRGQHEQSDKGVAKKGAGLGLSIVSAIAQAHGGHAWVESVEGQGATFGITLPVQSADDPFF
ncbi:Sensor histidine kinase MtrB [Corynebacterium felinum]|nr:Sensor histidine kinase MtrB [Corynebacterium felinum]